LKLKIVSLGQKNEMNPSMELFAISQDGGEETKQEEMKGQREDEGEFQTFHSDSGVRKKHTPFTMCAGESSSVLTKFLADGMLGRLARWLRLLGYDTVFQTNRSKEKLVQLAIEENRVFLTRDRKFTQREWPFSVVYVFSENPGEQLKQVVVEMKLDPLSRRFSLCSLCNVPVQNVERERIVDSVPRDVWKREKSFWECPRCRRIYWKGGHWRRMEERLAVLGLCKIE